MTNLPINRFAHWLAREGKYDDYLQLLEERFNPETVPGLMCRHLVSVDWRGYVYDCDFNQMLSCRWRARPATPWDIEPTTLDGAAIATGATARLHCRAPARPAAARSRSFAAQEPAQRARSLCAASHRSAALSMSVSGGNCSNSMPSAVARASVCGNTCGVPQAMPGTIPGTSRVSPMK